MAEDLRIAIVPSSVSPDSRYEVVIDLDRDASLSPTWRDGDLPKIEVTDRVTRRVLVAIDYFGDNDPDDLRPLRNRVELLWRQDSKAFAINIHDPSFSNSLVYRFDRSSRSFQLIGFPSYQVMTGYQNPQVLRLRPQGRTAVIEWHQDQSLVYQIMLSPQPGFTPIDPLNHRIRLAIQGDRLRVIRERKWVPYRPPIRDS